MSRIYYYGTVHMALDECRGSMWMKNKPNGDLDHTLYEQDLLSVVLIISKERVEFFKIFQGFYTPKRHQEAIADWADTLPLKNRNSSYLHPTSYLALEPSLVHTQNPAVRKAVEEKLGTKEIKILPFPPYSASLNPAEMLFNQIKYVARGRIK
jgi:hypothetical protein